MALFNRFPFSNVHELNLDWILRQIKDLLRRVKILEDSGGGGGGGGGTSDYNDLDNKPSINGVTLSGNKTASQLGLDCKVEIITSLSSLYTNTAAVLGRGNIPVLVRPSTTYYYIGSTASEYYYGTINNTPTNQIIKVNSANTVTNIAWPIPTAGNSTPLMDGTASAGVDDSKFSRVDHRHPSDTTKISAPANPATDDYLKWNGSEWIATALPVYNGGWT